MGETMDFPKTPQEFIEQNKFKDSEEVYTNGADLVPVFRVKQMIEHYIPADVTPVVHGRWCVGDFGFLNCSVCGKAMYVATKSTKEAELVRHHWKPFCPHCGTKMDADIPHDTADRCVCCGDVIPEGRQVCPACEGGEPTSKSD